MKTNKTIVCGFLAAIFVLTLAALSLTGCPDGGNGNNNGGGNSDVYIAGGYHNAATETATPCYWKNGVRTDLSFPAGTDCWAFGIAVNSNGDVYISGEYESGDRDEGTSTSTACYWKNGVRTDLSRSDETESSGWPNSIAVSSNGDVYVLGNYSIYDEDSDWGYTSTACYWKNGIRTDLDLSVPNGTYGDEEGIAVSSNGDVYISGGYSSGDRDEGTYTFTPCYWKNGVRTDLSFPNGADGFVGDEHGDSIAVNSKGDVYVVGNYETGGYYDEDGYWRTTSTDCYWKNGVRTDLSFPAGTDGWASGLDVSSNNDCYISGAWYNATTGTGRYCYWKNGVRTDMPLFPAGKEMGGELCGIAVSSNGDVYVLGNYETDYAFTACYWKNGVISDLSVPAGTDSSAYGIAAR